MLVYYSLLVDFGLNFSSVYYRSMVVVGWLGIRLNHKSLYTMGIVLVIAGVATVVYLYVRYNNGSGAPASHALHR